MTKPDRSPKIRGKSLWLGRALSCLVRGSICRTPLRASPIPRCSRPRSGSRAVAATSIGPVRAAVSPAPTTGSSPAPCLTEAIRRGAASRHLPHLSPAPLHSVPPLLHRRDVRPGRDQGPLHPPGRGPGRPTGGGGRLALMSCMTAPLLSPGW